MKILFDGRYGHLGGQDLSPRLKAKVEGMLAGVDVATLPLLDLAGFRREPKPWGHGYFLFFPEEEGDSMEFAEGVEPSAIWVPTVREDGSVELVPYWDGWESGKGSLCCEPIATVPPVGIGRITEPIFPMGNGPQGGNGWISQTELIVWLEEHLRYLRKEIAETESRLQEIRA